MRLYDGAEGSLTLCELAVHIWSNLPYIGDLAERFCPTEDFS